jgi:VIT1/CCC1 family predicted Fe2+/Mn2+ transporter
MNYCDFLNLLLTKKKSETINTFINEPDRISQLYYALTLAYYKEGKKSKQILGKIDTQSLGGEEKLIVDNILLLLSWKNRKNREQVRKDAQKLIEISSDPTIPLLILRRISIDIKEVVKIDSLLIEIHPSIERLKYNLAEDQFLNNERRNAIDLITTLNKSPRKIFTLLLLIFFFQPIITPVLTIIFLLLGLFYYKSPVIITMSVLGFLGMIISIRNGRKIYLIFFTIIAVGFGTFPLLGKIFRI